MFFLFYYEIFIDLRIIIRSLRINVCSIIFDY